jgi:tyrosine-specific transport protein
MQKQIGAVMLIAGTCIGSGTIALPMSLAKLGLIPSIAIMIITWWVAYYTSLVSVELNLHSDRGLSLGGMGRVFSGKYAEILGNISVKLLSYALLSVYIYGESSVIVKLLEIHAIHCSQTLISTILALGTFLLLQLPLHSVDRINRILFISLMAVFAVPLLATIASIDIDRMPMFLNPSCGDIASIVSVVFTSFGFQVIFHTLRDYLGKDAKGLKKSFLLGSMIPAIVYMLWTCGVLSVLYSFNKDFYGQMASGNIDVGEVINQLSKISNLSQLQLMIWWLSIFAILTSVLGVGVGLTGSFNTMMEKTIPSNFRRKIASALIVIVPSYLVAIIVPNAFIRVFKFAGAILAIIAILLPIYLLRNAKFQNLHYSELGNKWLLIFSIAFGVGVMAIEILGI